MSNPGQFLLYTAPDGAVKVDVFFREETVWLTQKALAELFGVKRPAITKHLKNIFESGELRENSVVAILETTAADRKTYATKYYNRELAKERGDRGGSSSRACRNVRNTNIAPADARLRRLYHSDPSGRAIYWTIG